MTKTDELTQIESVLVAGDLARLTSDQRLAYYQRLCESLGLNPLTQPFQYLQLSGKLTLYATKACTEQLRQLHGVSITGVTSAQVGDVYVVTATAEDRSGRTDCATGAVSIAGLKGDALANGLMKAETKAKRRCTLSLCGLGMLDESEIETIPGAVRAPAALPTTNGVHLAQALPEPVAEPEAVPAGDVMDLRSLCNWAIDLWPDVYTDDNVVKSTLRQHGVRTWGKRTDIAAVKEMLKHHAELKATSQVQL
jgi:hypothetical protein